MRKNSQLLIDCSRPTSQLLIYLRSFLTPCSHETVVLFRPSIWQASAHVTPQSQQTQELPWRTQVAEVSFVNLRMVLLWHRGIQRRPGDLHAVRAHTHEQVTFPREVVERPKTFQGEANAWRILIIGLKRIPYISLTGSLSQVDHQINLPTRPATACT